ncbi:MAG: SH3 domain-containing protein [Eubacteriales bacterium]|nr:SH3 domain-containing protein [Eubacteriales bacterium]
MKKAGLLVLLLGAVLCFPGCGFEDGAGATVTVIEATPTPEPTPTPEVTPTPEPTPIPEPVIVQTASGVNVEKKDGVYVANTDINLRADCSTEAALVASVASGTQLTSTGVCENGWVEVSYEGQTLYCSGDYVTRQETAPADPAAAAPADPAAITDGTQADPAAAVSDGTGA